MATIPTGQVSMNDVNVALEYTATSQRSLGDARVREVAGVVSGSLSMNTLRGKTFSSGPVDGTVNVIADRYDIEVQYTGMDPTQRIYIKQYYSTTRGGVNLGGYSVASFFPNASGAGSYYTSFSPYPTDAYRYAIQANGIDANGVSRSDKTSGF